MCYNNCFKNKICIFYQSFNKKRYFNSRLQSVILKQANLRCDKKTWRIYGVILKFLHGQGVRYYLFSQKTMKEIIHLSYKVRKFRTFHKMSRYPQISKFTESMSHYWFKST
jgi:hypothetical protein